jgi:hypothetical protein
VQRKQQRAACQRPSSSSTRRQFALTDASPISGQEVWGALVPATAQFPEGKVLVLSTPRWSTGWFADLCN